MACRAGVRSQLQLLLGHSGAASITTQQQTHCGKTIILAQQWPNQQGLGGAALNVVPQAAAAQPEPANVVAGKLELGEAPGGAEILEMTKRAQMNMGRLLEKSLVSDNKLNDFCKAIVTQNAELLEGIPDTDHIHIDALTNRFLGIAMGRQPGSVLEAMLEAKKFFQPYEGCVVFHASTLHAHIVRAVIGPSTRNADYLYYSRRYKSGALWDAVTEASVSPATIFAVLAKAAKAALGRSPVAQLGVLLGQCALVAVATSITCSRIARATVTINIPYATAQAMHELLLRGILGGGVVITRVDVLQQRAEQAMERMRAAFAIPTPVDATSAGVGKKRSKRSNISKNDDGGSYGGDASASSYHEAHALLAKYSSILPTKGAKSARAISRLSIDVRLPQWKPLATEPEQLIGSMPAMRHMASVGPLPTKPVHHLGTWETALASEYRSISTSHLSTARLVHRWIREVPLHAWLEVDIPKQTLADLRQPSGTVDKEGHIMRHVNKLIASGVVVEARPQELQACMPVFLVGSKIDHPGYDRMQRLFPEWANKWLLAAGKRAKERLVYDARGLNQLLPAWPYTMQRLSDLADTTSEGMLHKFDLTSAFHLIPLHPDSHAWVGFDVNGKCYKFTRMPFGVSLAPAICCLFSGMFTQVLKAKLPWRSALRDSMTFIQ